MLATLTGLRTLNLTGCTSLPEQVLQASSPAEVREALRVVPELFSHARSAHIPGTERIATVAQGHSERRKEP